jgi:hypothetical protein
MIYMIYKQQDNKAYQLSIDMWNKGYQVNQKSNTISEIAYILKSY